MIQNILLVKVVGVYKECAYQQIKYISDIDLPNVPSTSLHKIYARTLPCLP